MSALQVPAFLTFTISILVFFVGSRLNRSVTALSRWNIPEAVTGGPDFRVSDIGGIRII